MNVPIKNTAPSIPDIVKRKHIDKKLTDYFNGRLTWVGAPAGYGKSTLVSSFVTSRSYLYFWYGIDDNADPAGIFQSISTLLSSNGFDTSSLPAYHPNLQIDLFIFSRNYFQLIFELVGDFFIWVWDDFHHANNNGVFYAIFEGFLECLRDDSHCFVISRENPPKEFSSRLTDLEYYQVTSKDLQFCKSEVIELLGINQVSCREDELDKLLSYTEGWVVGLKLLITDYKVFNRFSFTHAENSRSYLFNYFSNILFNNFGVSEKLDLARLSLVPQFNVEIVGVLGCSENIIHRVDYMVATRFFLSFREGHTLPYAFHHLFLEFLRSKLEELESPEAIQELYGKLSRYFISIKSFDHLAAIVEVTKDSSIIHNVLVDHGMNLFETGRIETLKRFINSLSSNEIESNPWPLMLSGVVGAFSLPEQSLRKIRQALNLFLQSNDDCGLAMCWFSYANFSSMHWENLEEMNKILPTVRRRLDSYIYNTDDNKIKLKYIEGVVAFAAHYPKVNQSLGSLISDVEKYALNKKNPNQSPMLYRSLYLMSAFTGTGSGINKQVNSYLERKSRECVFSPLLNYVKNLNFCQQSFLDYDLEKAKQADADLKAIRNQYGINIHAPEADSYEIYIAILEGKLDSADAGIENYLRQPYSQFFVAIGHYYQLKAWQALNRGRWKESLEYSRNALDNMLASGMEGAVMVIMLTHALSSVLNSCWDDAASSIKTYESMLYSKKHQKYYDLLVVKSFYFLRKGEFSIAKDYLNQFIEEAMKNQYLVPFYPVYSIYSELYTFAFQNNLHKDYISKHVEILPIKNSNKANEFWPHRLKFYLHSDVEIILNHQKVKLGKKIPKKVIGLLAMILAHGATDVAVSKLCDCLWPEADGDSAKKSFDTTMHRLRKITGADSIKLENGMVSINPERCWANIWSLDEALAILKSYTMNEKLTEIDISNIEKQLSRVNQYFPSAYFKCEAYGEVLAAILSNKKSDAVRCVSQVGGISLSNGCKLLAMRAFNWCLGIDPNCVAAKEGLKAC